MPPHNYQLSTYLEGHKSDVRGVCTLPDGTVATASRDHSVRIWHRTQEVLADYTCTKSLQAHQHFVAAVAAISACDAYPLGAVVSASNDRQILVWNLGLDMPVMTLVGHEDTVCCVAIHGQDTVVSGSWDKTVRVWENGSEKQVLRGHEHSVWAVLALPTGHILSGSADRTIKLWRDTKCVQTFTGHEDAVRALLAVPGTGFLSGSNDCTLRLWKLTGECVRVFKGHDSFVYSLCNVPAPAEEEGDKKAYVASVSEDRTLRIWDVAQGTAVQTIIHPKPVWSVALHPSGDLITGSADGYGRVWTRNIARVASDDVLKAYDDSVTGASIPAGSFGGLDMGKVPDSSALNNPGKSDGQVMVVKAKSGAGAEAYQWIEAEARWAKIGDVLDKEGGGQKDTLNGKEYDFVFTVELDGSIRKFGYNNGDNPYVVAQEFLWAEMLDQAYLEEVAQFILKNTPQQTSEASAADAAQAAAIASASATAPPSSHSLGAAPTSAPRSGGGGGGVPKQSVASGLEYIPMQSFVKFETCNYAALRKKLGEFNDSMGTDPLALDAAELDRVDAAIVVLKETSRYHASVFAPEFFSVLDKVLQWPKDKAFPGLDLLRLVALHPSGAETAFKRLGGSHSHGLMERIISAFGLGSESSIPTRMLILRFVANGLARPEAREGVYQCHAQILEEAAHCAEESNSNLVLAYVTVLLNFSVLFHQRKESQGKLLVLSALLGVLTEPHSDEQIDFRSLVALGTLVIGDDDTKALAESMDIRSIVENFVSKPGLVGKAAKEALKSFSL